jgi:hypothetical protein
MDNKKQITLLLILLGIGIILYGLTLFNLYSIGEINLTKKDVVIENTIPPPFILNMDNNKSNDISDGLDKAYYNYIIKNNDTVELKNYWSIKTSKPTWP